MLLPDQSLVKQRALCTKGESELQRYLETESELDGCWEVEEKGVSRRCPVRFIYGVY